MIIIFINIIAYPLYQFLFFDILYKFCDEKVNYIDKIKLTVCYY